jgi:hypothetical protein
VLVGTQHDSKALKKAIETSKAHRAPGRVELREALQTNALSDIDCNYRLAKEPQHGISVPRNGLAPQPREGYRHTSGDCEAEDRSRLALPSCWGMDIRGDEAIMGPVFNYARIYTWFAMATTIENGMRSYLDTVRFRQVLANSQSETDDVGQPSRAAQVIQVTQEIEMVDLSQTNSENNNPQNELMDSKRLPMVSSLAPPMMGDDLRSKSSETTRTLVSPGLTRSTSDAVAESCGMAQISFKRDNSDATKQDFAHYRMAYPEKIPWILVGHSLIASSFAFLIQAGTTSAAILSAYETPVEGFGCRSGAYVLYGILGTMSCLLLVFSALMSQYVMARYQYDLLRHPQLSFRHSVSDYTQRVKSSGLGFNYLRFLAVSSRVLGKLFAGCNTIFIITISIAEIAGGFENCWCNGTALDLGNQGWIILFRTDLQWMEMVKNPWQKGFYYGSGVSILAMLFLFLCRYKNDIPRWIRRISKRENSYAKVKTSRESSIES